MILDHLNGRNSRTAYLEQLIDQGHVLASCTVNITKVNAGLRPGEEETTEKFLASLACLPVSPAIARQAGLLRRDWRARGVTLSYADVTIAAVALADQAALLTDNKKHFPEAGLDLWPLPK